MHIVAYVIVCCRQGTGRSLPVHNAVPGKDKGSHDMQASSAVLGAVTATCAMDVMGAAYVV